MESPLIECVTGAVQAAWGFLVQCIPRVMRGVFLELCVLLLPFLAFVLWIAERVARRRGWVVVDSTVRGDALQTGRRPDGRRALLRDLKVKAGGWVITVPKDFVTDYSSIPWFGRWLVRWSKVDVAGVVHDYLYSCARGKIHRLGSDWIWKEIAGSGERYANVLQRWLAWMALVLGGGFTYTRIGRKLDMPEERRPEWMRNRCPGRGCVRRARWEADDSTST